MTKHLKHMKRNEINQKNVNFLIIFLRPVKHLDASDTRKKTANIYIMCGMTQEVVMKQQR